ncbi:CPBP family glutamic-type intramembrane protease [Arthrobacter yangruifuii]|uniref:CPBP family glutamic-type intramembrane protease n=1 Tax=Arthrobacter yangruifuii TaxID=2606616 RepID=UPI0018850D0F|nr:CPBP family glutamic-type intramembrane protease [Arthrobacter yangruifuii]
MAIGISEALGQSFGWGRLAEVLLQALLMTAIVVPGIVALRRRLDHRGLDGLGVSRSVVRPLTLGVAVGAVTGLLVWLPAGLAGWIRVEQVDVAAFLGFLLLNGVVLALYEAFPEELALRGYVWTNLRDGWGTAVATLVTTALFPFIGVVVGPVRWAVTTVLGGDGGHIEVFPAGNDPVVYIVQLVLFGLALIAARRIPLSGALLVAVAFHWTQLTVTRTVLGGTGWLDSGWAIAWVEPDAIVLVLVHIVLAGIVFVAIRRRLERRAGRTGAANEGTASP